jgi:hypothetical protein
MLDKSAQAGQHAYKERRLDCYETPVCAVEALLCVENIPHFVWEPACGPGAIVKVLRARGHEVFATDKFDYGWDYREVFASDKFDFSRDYRIADFFVAQEWTGRYPGDPNKPAIVTNPPYQLAAQFVRHAIELKCPYIAMLLRLAFYESERRGDILDDRPPARIHTFKRRLPMMHRAGWTGPRASSAIAFAWFVWDQNYHGPTIIDRISY